MENGKWKMNTCPLSISRSILESNRRSADFDGSQENLKESQRYENISQISKNLVSELKTLVSTV